MVYFSFINNDNDMIITSLNNHDNNNKKVHNLNLTINHIETNNNHSLQSQICIKNHISKKQQNNLANQRQQLRLKNGNTTIEID